MIKGVAVPDEVTRITGEAEVSRNFAEQAASANSICDAPFIVMMNEASEDSNM